MSLDGLLMFIYDMFNLPDDVARLLFNCQVHALSLKPTLLFSTILFFSRFSVTKYRYSPRLTHLSPATETMNICLPSDCTSIVSPTAIRAAITTLMRPIAVMIEPVTFVENVFNSNGRRLILASLYKES